MWTVETNYSCWLNFRGPHVDAQRKDPFSDKTDWNQAATWGYTALVAKVLLPGSFTISHRTTLPPSQEKTESEGLCYYRGCCCVAYLWLLPKVGLVSPGRLTTDPLPPQLFTVGGSSLIQVTVLLFQSVQSANCSSPEALLRPLKLMYHMLCFLENLQWDHSIPFIKKAIQQWTDKVFNGPFIFLPSAFGIVKYWNNLHKDQLKTIYACIPHILVCIPHKGSWQLVTKCDWPQEEITSS